MNYQVNQTYKATKVIRLVVFLLLVLSVVIIITNQNKPDFVVTTASCPYLDNTIQRSVIELNGWVCEAPIPTGDILQPSGLWVFATVDCHKLDVPIEEYCKTNKCHNK